TPNLVMADMLSANPKSLEARLLGVRDLLQRRPLDDQTIRILDEVLSALRQKFQDRAEVYLPSAELELARGDDQKARNYLEQGIQINQKPQEVIPFYLALGRLELQVVPPRPQAAIASLRLAKDALGADGDVLQVWTLANLFLDAGEVQDAQKL